ncbi:MAG: Exodeoxyribonuclease III [Bacteroidetes bacterium ADurb.BinA174]|jgi:endonuclease/exonuclease/phosphatase family metal-dependent hydrolase|nr:MAG: Exodeoxyribonuclease III [Bacteroidetes bacterium ADurb.BinA174]
MKFRYAFLLALFTLLFNSCSISKKTSSDRPQLKILSYNIRNARGMDEIVDFDRVANVIKRINTDCVAIQELDSATERSDGIVVLDELAKRTGMYAAYNASIDYQGGKYGVGMLTKEKPLRFHGVPLPGSEEKRSLLIVEMKDYVICSTHWSLRQPDRFASVAVINEALKKYTDKPVFLAGDLNAVSESEEIKEISKEWVILNDPAQPTIPVVNPNRCIDYVFGKQSDVFSFEVVQTKVENEPVASDHLPVWTEVRIIKK